jgi:hypothetical protein
VRASAGVSKNVTRSRRGRRLAHDGRQYTPVLRTAYTNNPSALRSWATTAFQRAASLSFSID